MKRKGDLKKGWFFLFVFLASLTWGSSAYAEKTVLVSFGTVNTEVFGGLPEFGVEMVFKKNEWPISFVVGYRASGEEHTTYLYTDPKYGRIISEDGLFRSELAFGVRKIWGSNAIQQFFLGGGLTIAYASKDYSIVSEEVYCGGLFCGIYLFGYGSAHEQALGLWLDGGIYLIRKENLTISMNVRWSKADSKVELGGTHFGIQAGIHF